MLSRYTNIWEGSTGKQRVTEVFEIFSRYWRVVLPVSGSLLLASLTGGLSGDLFNLLITRELGWESSKLSIIYFLMLLSVPIQMLGPSLARQAGYRKMMSIGVTVMLICLVIMLFAVWYPASKFHQLFLLGMCAVVVEIAYSLSFGTVWSAWISEIVPREKRPGVMAITSIISQCSMITAFVIQTVIFHGQVSKTFYSALTIATIAYTISSLIAIRGLPTVEEMREESINLSSIFSSIFRDTKILYANPQYRTLTLEASLQLFVGVPLIAVFISQLIGTDPKFVALALLLKPVTSIFVMFFIARRGDRIEPIRSILISGSVVAVTLVGWLFLTLCASGNLNQAVRNTVPLLLVPLMFGAKAIYSVMVSHITVDIMRKEHRLAFYTLTDILSSSSIQIVNSLGGLAITASTASNYQFYGIPIPVTAWIIIGLLILLYLLSRYKRMSKAMLF